VGLDDLTGNGQAEAGVLAKALLWPVRVKTLENPLEGVSGDAGAIIVDHDLDARAPFPIFGTIWRAARGPHGQPNAAPTG
jgi:hypothetical protein